MSARRVLLTGATGVVGRRAIPQLLTRGCRVTAVGRTLQARTELAAMGADPIALDLFDPEAARRALDGHEVVINLATHMPRSAFQMLFPWSWRENDRVRRAGSATLARAAREAGVSRFIQESFAPVYVDGGAQWIDESWPQKPAPYNRTVLDAEASAARFGDAGGAAVVLRFGAFYGPDASLRDMIGLVRHGWAPLFGAEDAYWSSVSHEDAASAAVAALDVPAGTYNVCDDEPLPRRAWADAFAEAVGARRPRFFPRWLTAFGGATVDLLSRSQRMTNAKLKGASSWTPRWRSAREGLPAAVKALDGRVQPAGAMARGEATVR
jgi:nucleoside-diphosphate-sugar epimerase